MMFSMTALCTSGSRTTPPEPTCCFVASNWGFMRIIISASEESRGMTVGRTLSTEINDRSSVARFGVCPSSISVVRCFRFVRSSTNTRLSVRIFSATCPYPTSTPYTLFAPFCKRQSVNPPVDRPESKTTLPVTLIEKYSSARSIFSPARHTYFGTSAVMRMVASFGTGIPALVAGTSLTKTFPWAIQDDCTVDSVPRRAHQVFAFSQKGSCSSWSFAHAWLWNRAHSE
mmetsp:Transcript_23403/g.45658  ORF Transcript_23403/g.45658 Transcript_23403/m.45658 type:complete len:229 (+) Transcript_23403:154-840(+)